MNRIILSPSQVILTTIIIKMEKLPTEVKEDIFILLDVEEYLSLSLVNQDIHNVSLTTKSKSNFSEEISMHDLLKEFKHFDEISSKEEELIIFGNKVLSFFLKNFIVKNCLNGKKKEWYSRVF